MEGGGLSPFPYDLPKYDDEGSLTNGTFSGIDIYGIRLTEEQFVKEELNSLNKIKTELITVTTQRFLDTYTTYLKNEPLVQITSKKSKLPDYCQIGVLFAKGEIKKVDEGYKLVFNVGRKGGQVVDHVHLHLLGGWK